MKYSINVWGGVIILSLFTLSFSGNGIKASSCHTNGTCYDLCGTPAYTACSYAWCDDEIGGELCMSGEVAESICDGDYEITEEVCW